MRQRRGITLIEVLVSIFIMAIGMLALLSLFPLGALSMAQALQHDRAAAAAKIAAEYAEALDLRHDPKVMAEYTASPPGFPELPTTAATPSWPVFVDGFGGLVSTNRIGASLPATPGIARVIPSYATSLQLTALWFSMPDDIVFAPNGTPDVSGGGGLIQRGGRFTWAYLLRRPHASDPALVYLAVVVYAGRNTQTSGGESAYSASGNKGESNLTLKYNPAQGKPALRQNAWILDATYDPTTKVVHGDCYRVVNVSEIDGQTLSLEVEEALEANVNTVVVMDNVIEVLKMGTGRMP